MLHNCNNLIHNIKKHISIGIILGTIVLTVSCREYDPENRNSAKKPGKETLLKLNKQMVKSEDQKIEDFLSRYNWDMNQTPSGLRYMIYHQANGPESEPGMNAKINYSVRLLTGDEIYNSDDRGPKEFVIGKGQVEKGLEEGILLLNEGDRAKFVIPSHLAFGLVGDADKIPAKATLVYDVELIELK